MNILILNWRDTMNPRAGGAELVTLEFAKKWIKKGHKVTWFTSSFPGALPKETIENVELIRYGNSATVILFAPLFYFFSGRKFDLVIDEIHGLPFFTPLYVRKPKIAFIHEVAGEIWNLMYKFPVNIIGRLSEKLYFRLYKHVLFWTDAPSTNEELEQFGISRSQCFSISLPITNMILKQLPKKESKPTFIFVSRLVKMKGIEDIIKAFSFIFPSQKAKAQLWIVGGGEEAYVKKLDAMVNELNLGKHVRFWGKVSEQKKLQLLQKAHLLLHASVKEGWGLVVVEAASQGTPSVVYDVAGLRDSVQHNKTGIVIAHNTPLDMAEEALTLLKNKRKYHALQKQALSFARGLTWEQAGDKSLALLERAVKGNYKR